MGMPLPRISSFIKEKVYLSSNPHREIKDIFKVFQVTSIKHFGEYSSLVSFRLNSAESRLPGSSC